MDAEQPSRGGVALWLRRLRGGHGAPAAGHRVAGGLGGAGGFSLEDVVPLVGQLRGYSPRRLPRDVVAALGVAVTLVPQGLAYGSVAGLAPAAGLYTAVGAALVFGLLTATRFVAVGPSATLAVLTFAAVQGPAGATRLGPRRWRPGWRRWPGCSTSPRCCCGCRGWRICCPDR